MYTNAHDAAVSRFQSLCAGENCPACTNPTIVSSTKSPTSLNHCTCVRNIPNEWWAVEWLNKIPQNSLVLRKSELIPVTNVGTDQASSTMGTRAPFTPKSADYRKLQDHLRANAMFARRKAESTNASVARHQSDRLLTFGSGISLADALRTALKATSTVNVPPNDDPQPVEADNSSHHFSDRDISRVVSQLQSRAASSMDSYNSMMRQTSHYVPGTEWPADLRRAALEKSQLDPVDFCPHESALLTASTPTQALDDLNKRTSPSVLVWLLLNDVEGVAEDQESVCICVG
jgi:hypothetical protein